MTSTAYSVKRAPSMSFNRPYNAHTRRIITTASVNVFHLSGNKLNLTVYSADKNQADPRAKKIKDATLKVTRVKMNAENIV